MNIKNLLRKLKWFPRNLLVLILVFLIRSLPEERRSRIVITFDAQRAEDGTGAQVQRLVAVKALSLILRCNYLHTPIEKVAIHPLDPFQDVSGMRKFVDKVNNLFVFQEDKDQEPRDVIAISDLRLSHLWTFYHSSKLRYPILFKVLNPYLLVDLLPRFYKEALSTRVEAASPRPQAEKKSIAMHYRQGVGGFAIYPGMKVSRQIPIEVYTDRLRQIVKGNESRYSITVFTDAPKKTTLFKPPKDQIHLWVGTPGFNEDTMKVEELDVLSSVSQVLDDAKLHVGGDPLEAIIEISNSDIIFMSRSSLSYVAAMLAQEETTVFYPKDFWHPKLPSWKYL